MKILKCTYDEAYQIILDDKKVDKMTSVKEIEDDLTEEQKKINKQMRSTTSGKKQTRKARASVTDVNKTIVFNTIHQALAVDIGMPTTVKPDKEMIVKYGGVDYKITISVPRVKKEEA